MAKAFHGGVHPPDQKFYSKDAAIEDAPIPKEFIVPFQQHIGAPARAVLKPGDVVKRGQMIAEAGGFVSEPVHSPVSGTVKRIVDTTHPMGMKCQAALIESDGLDTWAEDCNVEVPASTVFTPEEIRAAAKWAGLAGMGGATFPTHVKLSPPPGKSIDTVILNGVECEPYLTSDHRLMLESPQTIVQGLALLMQVFGAKRGVIGIEANKPDAHETICTALAAVPGEVSAQLLPVMYPQGAEKQLIVAITGREVPSGGLPMDIGVCVVNVGTAHALWEALYRKRPLIERIVSVTGPGVQRPANLRARLGTPARVLLEHCGWLPERTNKLIYGGPMMGASHYDPDVSVSKGMSGILALTDAKIYEYRDCIRCGRCVEGCPARIIPSELSIECEREAYLETKELNVLDCIECGVCTYICPARRPIVQWIKVAKGELARERARALAKEQAEKARAEAEQAEKARAEAEDDAAASSSSGTA